MWELKGEAMPRHLKTVFVACVLAVLFGYSTQTDAQKFAESEVPKGDRLPIAGKLGQCDKPFEGRLLEQSTTNYVMNCLNMALEQNLELLLGSVRFILWDSDHPENVQGFALREQADAARGDNPSAKIIVREQTAFRRYLEVLKEQIEKKGIRYGRSGD
jgi:hypothetical protein